MLDRFGALISHSKVVANIYERFRFDQGPGRFQRSGERRRGGQPKLHDKRLQKCEMGRRISTGVLEEPEVPEQWLITVVSNET